MIIKLSLKRFNAQNNELIKSVTETTTLDGVTKTLLLISEKVKGHLIDRLLTYFGYRKSIVKLYWKTTINKEVYGNWITLSRYDKYGDKLMLQVLSKVVQEQIKECNNNITK